MLVKLLQCVREYRKASMASAFLVTCEAAVECAIPFTIANLVNQIKSGCSLDVIWSYSLQLVAMAFLSLGFGCLAGMRCATASCGLARNLRHDLFWKIQTFSFANIDKFSSSSLVTRLTTDVTNVQNAYMMLIRTAFRSPLMLIFSFTMAWYMGGKMALIYLFTIPVLGFSLWVIIRKAIRFFERIFYKYDNLNNSVQENIQGMRVVKSFVRESYEKQKFRAAAGEVCADFTAAEKILAYNNPIMQFCIFIGMLFVIYVGSYVIITSRGLDLDVGQFSALATYSFQILNSLMMLSMVFVMITMAGESAKRIVQVLAEAPSLVNPEQPVLVVPDGSVEFRDVSFKYSLTAKRQALSHINLKLASGSTVGILGGTGSSKSTLVQLIARLYDATEGQVLVGGLDVRRYDLKALREQVAMVLQKNVLFAGTVKENLRWGRQNATDEEIIQACKLAQADEFISSWPRGYDTVIEQGGANVSGGQKQRLCIARALLKQPRILILDDSTSAVDTRTDKKIRTALKEYLPATTKLIIAQRIASVEGADQLVILEGGSIVAAGTHEELLAGNEIYREIYYSQNQAGLEPLAPSQNQAETPDAKTSLLTKDAWNKGGEPLAGC